MRLPHSMSYALLCTSISSRFLSLTYFCASSHVCHLACRNGNILLGSEGLLRGSHGIRPLEPRYGTRGGWIQVQHLQLPRSGPQRSHKSVLCYHLRWRFIARKVCMCIDVPGCACAFHHRTLLRWRRSNWSLCLPNARGDVTQPFGDHMLSNTKLP